MSLSIRPRDLLRACLHFLSNGKKPVRMSQDHLKLTPKQAREDVREDEAKRLAGLCEAVGMRLATR